MKPATDAALSALDAMWASVDAACERAGLTTLTERPAGGFTLGEYAERRGINKSTALSQVSKMMRAGALTRYSVRIPDSRGHLTPTAVFVSVEP